MCEQFVNWISIERRQSALVFVVVRLAAVVPAVMVIMYVCFADAFLCVPALLV